MTYKTSEVCELIIQRGLASMPLTHYTGILFLYGMARHALAGGYPAEKELR